MTTWRSERLPQGRPSSCSSIRSGSGVVYAPAARLWFSALRSDSSLCKRILSPGFQSVEETPGLVCVTYGTSFARCGSVFFVFHLDLAPNSNHPSVWRYCRRSLPRSLTYYPRKHRYAMCATMLGVVVLRLNNGRLHFARWPRRQYCQCESIARHLLLEAFGVDNRQCHICT